MKRHEFLKLCGLGLLAMSLDPWEFFPALAAPEWPVLILLELKGGNDGLNTVVPFADPSYARLRPRLALPREQLLHLSPDLGLHPALKPLWEAWQAREWAWVLGVGYPQANRSHFRSIEIWETASAAHEYLQEGWLARVLPHWPRRSENLVDGLYFHGSPGPLDGTPLRTLAAGTAPLREAEGPEHAIRAGNPALQHILQVQQTLAGAEQALKTYHNQVPSLVDQFPQEAFGRDLAEVTRLILARAPIPVYRVSLGSFDTHRQQARTQAQLLQHLATGLARLRAVLKAHGAWQRVLVMTYSEFGRRPAENASGGTDHGTAAPHFFLGGRVRGGLYGHQPALGALVDQDLQYAVDFRSLYQTVVQSWWGIQGTQTWSGQDFKPLPVLR